MGAGAAVDRVDPPLDGEEAAQLFGFLDFQRATLQQKAAGLDAEQLARTLAPSTMTLAGLLKHMALVEDHWFSVFLHGNEMAAPWRGVDWEQDPDWEWHSAGDDAPDDLRALLGEAVETSRRLAAGVELGHLSARKLRSGRAVNLRWIVLHMIEEYARHNGHADLIRESIDGSVGE
jgi:uncharacterized damage-inducible protein DinB